MGTNLIGILSLRDKLIRLIFEPTLDKVFSVFASTMLGTSIVAFFTTYTDPYNIQMIRTSPSLEVIVSVNVIIIISFLLAALSALTALFYKRKHEPILKQEDERRKSNTEWDYLFKHKHLEKVDITLDKVDEWRKEMEWLRNAIVSLIKYTVEKNSLTPEDRKAIENPEALPSLPNIPSFPDLSDDFVSATATPPMVTADITTSKEIKPEKSVTQKLNDLETLENLEI